MTEFIIRCKRYFADFKDFKGFKGFKGFKDCYDARGTHSPDDG